jgi:hypothetical protein
MCRALRLARHLKLREVAELAKGANGVGLATATIGTIESSPYRVISPERAAILADKVFGLQGDERQRFLELHEQTPLSKFSETRREQWQKRNALRAKLRNFDLLAYAACELAIRFIQDTPRNEVCRCDEGGGSYGDKTKPCEVCFLLERLGILGGLGDAERTLAKLATKMRDLEPKIFPGRKANT